MTEDKISSPSMDMFRQGHLQKIGPRKYITMEVHITISHTTEKMISAYCDRHNSPCRLGVAVWTTYEHGIGEEAMTHG
ncbi:uncharacterized protein LOC135496796 isoform X2 [Lineus longissimus]